MNIRNIVFFIIASILLISCGDDETSSNRIQEVDMTLNRKIVEDNTNVSYNTFYKPASAVTGDVMPYYNEADQTFYMYFLIGQFTSFYKGGIYMAKTKDLANFITNAIPQITDGTQDARDFNIGKRTVLIISFILVLTLKACSVNMGL